MQKKEAKCHTSPQRKTPQQYQKEARFYAGLRERQKTKTAANMFATPFIQSFISQKRANSEAMAVFHRQ